MILILKRAEESNRYLLILICNSIEILESLFAIELDCFDESHFMHHCKVVIWREVVYWNVMELVLIDLQSFNGSSKSGKIDQMVFRNIFFFWKSIKCFEQFLNQSNVQILFSFQWDWCKVVLNESSVQQILLMTILKHFIQERREPLVL